MRPSELQEYLPEQGSAMDRSVMDSALVSIGHQATARTVGQGIWVRKSGIAFTRQ